MYLSKFLFWVLALTLLVSTYAHAERKKAQKAFAACGTIIQVTSGGYIYKNSAPLRSGGIGTPLIGYRKEPTLIMSNNVSARKTTNVYASNGTLIMRCPWASAEGTRGGRYRCTSQTSAVRRSAVRVSGSPAILFALNVGNKCVRVTDAGKCYGSSKGLCNQTIK